MYQYICFTCLLILYINTNARSEGSAGSTLGFYYHERPFAYQCKFGRKYVSVFISCDFALFMAINLSCVTLNVRGLNNKRKRRQVFRWLHGRKFQIIFLQEVYSWRDMEKTWSAKRGGKIVFCHGTKHSCGTLVLFHPSLDDDVEYVEVDKRGREIVLCAKIDDYRFTFINVYTPNDIKTQVEFF